MKVASLNILEYLGKYMYISLHKPNHQKHSDTQLHLEELKQVVKYCMSYNSQGFHQMKSNRYNYLFENSHQDIKNNLQNSDLALSFAHQQKQEEEKSREGGFSLAKIKRRKIKNICLPPHAVIS